MDQHKNITEHLAYSAKQGAELNIKTSTEDLTPAAIIATKDIYTQGFNIGLFLMPPDKDFWQDVLKSTLSINNAVGYSLVTEAYMTTFGAEAIKRYNGRVRDMPPDYRYEAAVICTVTRTEDNTFDAKIETAKINRNSDGSRSIEDWETASPDAGRILVKEW